MDTKQTILRTYLTEAKDFMFNFGVIFGILWVSGSIYSTVKSNKLLRLRVDQLERQLNEGHPAVPQTDTGMILPILPLERSAPGNADKWVDGDLLMK